jgi:hypothetical protein
MPARKGVKRLCAVPGRGLLTDSAAKTTTLDVRSGPVPGLEGTTWTARL